MDAAEKGAMLASMARHPPERAKPVEWGHGVRIFGISFKWRPRWWKRGVTREVFLIGRWAVKIPSIRSFKLFLTGMLANIQEREFSAAGWEELCPVVFAVPGGWLSVMPRGRPLSPDDWIMFDHREFCSRGCHYAAANYDGNGGHVNHLGAEPEGMVVPAENKVCSFGWLNDRIVAVDYGN